MILLLLSIFFFFFFPSLHLLVVSAFPRISASVQQNRAVDRRDDVFLPWLAVGAGASKTASKQFVWLNSCSYCWAISKAVCLFEQVTPIKSDDLAGCLPAVLPWLRRARLVRTLIPDDLGARSQIE